MLVIIDGVQKDIHYSIAKILIESGKAIVVNEVNKVEKKEKFEKKIVKNQGKKKQ
jgi:hypothetical protein